MMEPMDVRRAGPDDLELVADTLALAFSADPAWTWVFDDPTRCTEQLRSVWGLLLRASVGHGWIWMTAGAGAVTQWVPPGVDELTPEEELAMGRLMDELLGADVWRATALVERFGAARPAGPDHYYLSLFGTRPDARGRGLGMALLADNLARVDAEGMPAYLESTNPVNLDRYRSVGFVDADVLALPDGGPVVTTMWREPRSGPPDR
jgi:GNAT superfamily N-acetyltransferase